jgi:D-tagatose-1,6-bisphosphate aldolase subunit GatZ/KbaZ
MGISSYIKNIVRNKLSSSPPGIFSVCSANPFVLKASMIHAKNHEIPLLVESTCNQVNQFGGYMNLNPAEFINYVTKLREEVGLSRDSFYLGGDHLGPSVWQNEPSDSAMEKAIELTHQYIRAGYKKIHLDASMSCAGDEIPLPKKTIAEREARLCAAAVNELDATSQDISELVFVVGTEVPTPGGAVEDEETLEVSSVEETEENILHTEDAFMEHNLGEAWEQTFAFVVQPGVEFSDTNIHAYDRKKAANLSRLIEKHDQLIFEAHSTDYQSEMHLKQMVSDHFAILKVGPALTFALREALYALEDIERELVNPKSTAHSDLKASLDSVMVEHPKYWGLYYSTDPSISNFQRKYSFLDRCRYYWSFPMVVDSVNKLINNLSGTPIPLSLISHYLPRQFEKARDGAIKAQPQDLIKGKITDVLDSYLFACRTQ